MSARILIVHNEDLALQQAKVALEPPHFVTTSGGISQAMALLKELEQAQLPEIPFDLILCSVHMDVNSDELTIFDLLKWFKGNSQAQNIPFLAVCFNSAEVAQYLGDSVRLAGLSLGAAGYEEADPCDTAAFLELAEAYLPDALRSRSQETSIQETVAKLSATNAIAKKPVVRMTRRN